MVASHFDKALARVLAHEGGFVHHAKDPGGATNQGITQRIYDAYRRGRKTRSRTVRLLLPAERDAIYRRQYWDAVNGDILPKGADYVVFDGAVNSGPKQAIKWLQRALGAAYRGKIDGVIGLATLAALDDVDDWAALIDRICDRRMIFLRSLKHWRTFGKGWTRRVDNVRAVGKADIDGIARIETATEPGGDFKALVSDAQQPPSKAPADAATGGGIGAGGIAGTLQQLQEQLTPLSAAGEWITVLVVILATGGAALAIGGIGWRWYAKQRERQLADALDLETPA